jgi:hypothetical protein
MLSQGTVYRSTTLASADEVHLLISQLKSVNRSRESSRNQGPEIIDGVAQKMGRNSKALTPQ